MPSWSSRFLPNSSNLHTPPAAATPNPLDKDNESHQSPITESTQLSTSPSKQRQIQDRQLHSRSFSHPFPSFLGGPKRRNVGLDDSSTDEDVVVPHEDRPPPTRDSKPVLDQDGQVQVGNCITCDSKVRWPKNVDVFRCATCLTINDRKPMAIEVPDLPDKAGTYPGTVPARRPLPLCVERTKAIADRCVASYLEERRKRAKLFHQDTLPASSVAKAHEPPPTLPFPATLPLTIPQRTPPKPLRKPPPLPVKQRGPDTSLPPPSPLPNGPSPPSPRSTVEEVEWKRHHDNVKAIFKPLEDYIVAYFGNRQCLNASFTTTRPVVSSRTFSEGSVDRPDVSQEADGLADVFLDAKTLLLGDFAENGTWWAGGRVERERSHRSPSKRDDALGRSRSVVSYKSPRIDWIEVQKWYNTVLTAGQTWRDAIGPEFPDDGSQSTIDEELKEARIHAQRTLLKVSEALLKRPGALLKSPDDIRFLLILLANPLLYPAVSANRDTSPCDPSVEYKQSGLPNGDRSPGSHNPHRTTVEPSRMSRHSGILKRILGLLANLPNQCHQYLISWFSRLDEEHFRSIVELVGGFVSHRLTRQPVRKKGPNNSRPGAGLVPDLPGASATASTQLHAALGYAGPVKSAEDGRSQPAAYSEDWQLKAAARVMALLFSANNNYRGVIKDEVMDAPRSDGRPSSAGLAAKQKAKAHGQLLPIYDFYNTLLDYTDLIADFETWEARKGRFSFCQYPFFLSLGAKIRIMEHDARRQMEIKAREAFFNSIMTNKTMEQHLVLRVRRECLVEDSLKSISQVVGAGQEEIKKGLRIKFHGEEGVDAGGLRKEWFLLLVREIFDPNHGMFLYDEDSNFCYFNPNSLETSDQYFLVGALLGLAIYNSTILDVALPPFLFKKLLASAPSSSHPGSSASVRPAMTLTLDDLAEYRPALAKGLHHLLTFEGNVAETFCRDFVAEVERYGHIENVPLCSNGEGRPVTNANRQEFVDLYVKYLLDTSVTRQFEPFKRGFFTVCGGNALSLFRAEEIEALIRGSEEELDVGSLKAVARYDGWSGSREADPVEDVDIVRWFWEIWEEIRPAEQRKVLLFLTGSDRLPAAGGSAGLVLRIVNGDVGGGGGAGRDGVGRGRNRDEVERFPVARTCFNMLVLGRYGSKESLRSKLWRAVTESEGFGLK